MFCSKCGSQVKDNAKFCDECGSPVNTGTSNPDVGKVEPIHMSSNKTETYSYTKREASKEELGDKKAHTAFIIGVLSLILCWFPILGIPAGIFSVVQGIMACKLGSKSRERIKALIFGFAGLLVPVLFVIFVGVVGALTQVR